MLGYRRCFAVRENKFSTRTCFSRLMAYGLNFANRHNETTTTESCGMLLHLKLSDVYLFSRLQWVVDFCAIIIITNRT